MKRGYRIEIMPGLYSFQTPLQFWWRNGFPMRYVWRVKLFVLIVWRRYDDQCTRLDAATAWSVAAALTAKHEIINRGGNDA